MSKRPFPFASESQQRQKKTHVTQRVREASTNMQEVYGARRAAQEQITLTQGASEDTETETMEMEGDLESYEMRQDRLDKLKRLEKRDPSPVPNANSILSSYIHATARTHGPYTEEEKTKLMQQAKAYRQLSLDSFFTGQGNQNRNNPEEEKDPETDENDNRDMEF